MKKKFALISLATLAILFASLFLFWTLKVEPDMLVLKKVDLHLPNWHKEHSGLKIAVISDTHFGTKYVDHKKVDAIVEMANKAEPDIIFLLGDFGPETIEKSQMDKKKL